MGIKKRYGIIAYGSFCGVWILMFLAFVFWAVSEFFPQEGSGWVLMKTGVWLAVAAIPLMVICWFVSCKFLYCPSCLKSGVRPPWKNSRPYYCPSCGKQLYWEGWPLPEKTAAKEQGKKTIREKAGGTLRVWRGRVSLVMIWCAGILGALGVICERRAAISRETAMILLSVWIFLDMVIFAVEMNLLRCPNCGKRGLPPRWSRGSVSRCSSCGRDIRWQ